MGVRIKVRMTLQSRCFVLFADMGIKPTMAYCHGIALVGFNYFYYHFITNSGFHVNSGMNNIISFTISSFYAYFFYRTIFYVSYLHVASILHCCHLLTLFSQYTNQSYSSTP